MNCDKNFSDKGHRHDEQSLFLKTLKAIKEPECFKYGEEFLFHALLSYIQNQKSKGVSIHVVKTNYIKTVLKRVYEPEKVP